MRRRLRRRAAAMCGYQSGAKGVWVAMPAFSREIKGCRRVMIRFPEPPPLFARYEAV